MDFSRSLLAKWFFFIGNITILIGIDLELERVNIILYDEAWI